MLIQSKNVWYREGFIPLTIEIENQKITNLYPYSSCSTALDFGSSYILPGLIDIHNHGYYGRDANHATLEWLQNWVDYLPSEGVTSFVPSISSAPLEDILSSLRIISDFMKQQNHGSEILGIYSEGPFVSIKYHGGQSLDYRQVPSIELFEKMQEYANHQIIRVMVAPEEMKEFSFIKYLREQNIQVSIGHSGATFDDCTRAIQAGVNSFTHTFNAMTHLHHRDPGCVGAAMYYNDIYAEIIADGIHVSPVCTNILAKLKGKNHLISVTDSSQFKGLPEGEHSLLGRTIIVGKDGSCRLPSGGLAGSSNKLCNILKHSIQVAKIDLVTAINSVTINPAKLLHVENKKGIIDIGYDADFCIMDNDFNVINTIVKGVKYN